MSTDYSKYKLICSLDVEAEKTSCYGNKMRIIDATLNFLGDGKDYIVAVGKGCVTGFEFFNLKPNELHEIGESEWLACYGTKGEWDRLCIPKQEMKRLYDKIISILRT